MSELVDLVDEQDRVIGIVRRSDCHGNPKLIHRAVHVLVIDHRDRLLLQKRAMTKQVQPGRWDTSVGGHLDPGEEYLQAARREMDEEIGICGVPLTFLYPSRIRSEFESENIRTYLVRYNGAICYEPREIDEVRFWSAEEIEDALGTGLFTPNFEDEWKMFRSWQRRHGIAGDRPVSFCAGDSFPDLSTSLGKKE